MRDVCAVCGDVVLVDEASRADIVICEDTNDEFSALSKDAISFSHAEEFVYYVKDGKIFFFGAGDLGVIWSLYTFSEKELHIPPILLFRRDSNRAKTGNLGRRKVRS